jgi:hypothetical protein
MHRWILVLFIFVGALATQLFAAERESPFGISGVVIHSVSGQPLGRTEVSIGKAEEFETTLQKVLTDTDGRFSFTGLQPGKYWLAARRNGFRRQGYEQHGGYVSAVAVGPTLASNGLIFRLHPDASISGTILDTEGDVVPNANVFLFHTDISTGFKQLFYVGDAFSDDRGAYHFSHLESGEYFVVVSAQPWYSAAASAVRQAAGANAAVSPSFIDLVYPTTYYPGVTEPSSASPILLHEGETFVVAMTLVAEPELRLRIGHVNDEGQQPRSTSLKQQVFGALIDLPATQENIVDDAVEVSGIPAGRYVLDIQSYTATISTRSRVVDVSADTEVDAADTTTLPSIRGVVQMDGGLNVRSRLLRLWNSRTEQMLDTQYSETGEFSINPEFLMPGTYAVFAMNGENSIISSISAIGAKVTGQSIQISGPTPIQLSIKLSRTLSKINGMTLRNGKPIAGAMIVLVPENPEWNMPLFRRDQSDTDGTFTLRDVLPGRYKILGIDDGWNLEWAAPAFLKAHLGHTVDVEVRANTTYQTVVKVE